MEVKKIKYLVADTTAFINTIQLNEYADIILTVPDVINEVKNKRQIRRLVVLPFDLLVREPKSEYLSFVANFAKQTGDFASLSGIDLKVIALTYELEIENNGQDHLRTKPILSRVIASKEKPEEFIDSSRMAGFFIPSSSSAAAVNLAAASEKDKNDKDSYQETEINIANYLEETAEEEEEEEENIDETYTDDELKKCLDNLKIDNSDENIDDILISTKNITKLNDNNEESDNTDTDDNDTNNTDDSDNEDAWITPSNIQNIKKELECDDFDVVPTVACMSTDFAIQNVLQQINLNIAALNGRVIKHIRTYILRCYSCFKTTSVMTKSFCPNCGNKTLKRVAVSLDEHGQQVVHINTRRPLTAKYKNQSFPRPKGGKHSRNPLLVEDQPIPKQMPSRVAKTKTNALHDDYTAGMSPFVVRDINSKSALLRTKGNIREWAKNNAYEEDRRKKHYNRLVK